MMQSSTLLHGIMHDAASACLHACGDMRAQQHCRHDTVLCMLTTQVPNRVGVRGHTCATALLKPMDQEVRMLFFLLAALACKYNGMAHGSSAHAIEPASAADSCDCLLLLLPMEWPSVPHAMSSFMSTLHNHQRSLLSLWR